MPCLRQSCRKDEAIKIFYLGVSLNCFTQPEDCCMKPAVNQHVSLLFFSRMCCTADNLWCIGLDGCKFNGLCYPNSGVVTTSEN